MPFNALRYTYTVLIGLGSIAMYAQTAQSASAHVSLPLAGVHYRYWPEQLVQWIGPELPYSIIVLDIDERGKKPVYDVEFIDKSGEEIVHYTNTLEQFADDQSSGFTVHQVPMQFDGSRDPSKGAQYMLRFNTESGVPVVWQFVLGTDVTEQGSGTTPIATANPVLLYREQGALAGEGTAIQIGNVTSIAAEWTELAQPPYFIPYRGAFSTGVHILSFVPGTTLWKADAQELTDRAGNNFSLSKNGKTLAMTNVALGTTTSYTMEGANVISSVSFGSVNAPRDHTVSIVFSPALTPDGQSSFDVIAGKKTKVAAGAVQTEKAAHDAISAIWTFNTPRAMHGKEAKSVVGLQ